MLKIVAFAKQRFSSRLGKGIGETIANIQSRPMAAVAEPAKGGTGNFCLIAVDSDNFNLSLSYKQIDLTPAEFLITVQQDNGRLHQVQG